MHKKHYIRPARGERQWENTDTERKIKEKKAKSVGKTAGNMITEGKNSKLFADRKVLVGSTKYPEPMRHAMRSQLGGP
jgi:ribosomal protein L17